MCQIRDNQNLATRSDVEWERKVFNTLIMESARAILETPRSERPAIVKRSTIVWSERKHSLLRRAKKRLYQWEQMLLGELLAWTLPATDYRRR
jgi:hypothetical protein